MYHGPEQPRALNSPVEEGQILEEVNGSTDSEVSKQLVPVDACSALRVIAAALDLLPTNGGGGSSILKEVNGGTCSGVSKQMAPADACSRSDVK